NPEVISVAELLRREGLRAPHSAPGRLRQRGPTALPFPDPVEPSGVSRRVAAAGSLLVVGTMLGSVALHDGAFTSGRDAGTDAEAPLGPGAVPGARAPHVPTLDLATALVDMSGVLGPGRSWLDPIGARPFVTGADAGDGTAAGGSGGLGGASGSSGGVGSTPGGSGGDGTGGGTTPVGGDGGAG